MRVAAGDHERQRLVFVRISFRFGFSFLQEHGVNVAFEVVHCDERNALGES